LSKSIASAKPLAKNKAPLHLLTGAKKASDTQTQSTHVHGSNTQLP
jgi:hypothetical protein